MLKTMNVKDIGLLLQSIKLVCLHDVSRATNVSSRWSRLEILMYRLGLVSAGEANVSVSSRSREVSISVSSRSRDYVSYPSLSVTDAVTRTDEDKTMTHCSSMYSGTLVRT